MIDFLITISTAALLFVSTNIDDIIVLTVLFLALKTSDKPKRLDIIMGQYIGIGALIGISIVAALGVNLIPQHWVRLLGLIPLALGAPGLIKVLLDRNNREEHPNTLGVSGFVGVAGVTIANGADNITVYTPLFHSLRPVNDILVIFVFAVLTALWCFIAARLGSHRHLTASIGKFARWIVPLVFIAIGLVILIQSG